MTYLGHVISKQGLSVDPSKVHAIREMPTQTGSATIVRHGEFRVKICAEPLKSYINATRLVEE